MSHSRVEKFPAPRDMHFFEVPLWLHLTSLSINHFTVLSILFDLQFSQASVVRERYVRNLKPKNDSLTLFSKKNGQNVLHVHVSALYPIWRLLHRLENSVTPSCKRKCIKSPGRCY